MVMATEQPFSPCRCDACAGSGHVYRNTDPLGMTRRCEKCGGSGVLMRKGGLWLAPRWW